VNFTIFSKNKSCTKSRSVLATTMKLPRTIGFLTKLF